MGSRQDCHERLNFKLSHLTWVARFFTGDYHQCRQGFITPTITFEGFNSFQNVSNGVANPVTLQAVKTIYQYNLTKQTMTELILESVIQCPECGFKKQELMPTDACLYFYQCTHCQVLLKPKSGDCCVFCSYGTTPCPPIQVGQSCCSNQL